MNATSKIGQSLCSYRIERYKLNGHDPILCEDLVSWLRWMETTGRWVQDSQFIDSARNPVRVCTVFLGIDMGFGEGEPILFETMVLGGTRDRELYRYCTWQEAEDGHTAVVERCKISGAPLQDHPSLSKARELADQTVKKASEIAITSLIEQSFRDHQPAK